MVRNSSWAKPTSARVPTFLEDVDEGDQHDQHAHDRQGGRQTAQGLPEHIALDHADADQAPPAAGVVAWPMAM
jgi:hypothetical protein